MTELNIYRELMMQKYLNQPKRRIKSLQRKLSCLVMSIIPMLPLSVTQAQSLESQWQTQTAEQLRVSVQDFYNQTLNDDAAVRRWFSKDYIQVADGNTLNFADFIKHLNILKRDTTSMRFEVIDAAFTGDTLADRHLVYVELKNGQRMVVEILAFYRLKNGKIVRLNEVSRVISGDLADRDLGFRTE